MSGERCLIVTADDFGIGPETSRGILDLAEQGRVSAAVLLVNSPHAAAAVLQWRQRGRPMELGWHPCLTLDRPILPPRRVPSLVSADGSFRRLGPFVARLWTGRIRDEEIAAELQAQYERFLGLVGSPPSVVNAHHHLQLFAPIGATLIRLLRGGRPLPYVRRVREPWPMLARIPGARGKRVFLSAAGRLSARQLDRAGFPGNDWLAGITDPREVADASFLVRWLGQIPGRVVELTCHPGYPDLTLAGRDGAVADGSLQRRPRELGLLRAPSFLETCRRAGFRLVPPSGLLRRRGEGHRHAA